MAEAAAPESAGIERLRLSMAVRRAELEFRRAKARQRLGRTSAILGPVLVIIIYVTTRLTWRKIDLGLINSVAIPLTLLLCLAAIDHIFDISERPDVDELELELAQAAEERRDFVGDLSNGIRTRRTAYKEQIGSDLSALRAESARYRRVHNGLQSVIIVFSIANTTITGIALDGSAWQWPAVGVSFAVGISAGFMGYFKFRERSFYLQQTADAIEQALNASELSIFRYGGLTGDEALQQLVEEVESLKAEQRKREQSLDQPADARREPMST